MKTSQNIKTKTDLIEIIQNYRKTNDGAKLKEKIMRQVKLHNLTYEKEWKKLVLNEEEKSAVIGESKAKKKSKIKRKTDWEILESKLGVIMEQWQKKQVELIINQFLKEIELGLKKGESIILRNHFSLGIMESKERKGVNPSIVKKLKSPNLSPEEKTKLEAEKEIKIPPQKRIRFKTSPKLKREIN